MERMELTVVMLAWEEEQGRLDKVPTPPTSSMRPSVRQEAVKVSPAEVWAQALHSLGLHVALAIHPPASIGAFSTPRGA